MTYSVWMRVPHEGSRDGWSRVAGGLEKAQAEWMSEALFFDARAMPDQPTADNLMSPKN